MSFCHEVLVTAVTRITPHMIRVQVAPIGDWRWTTEGHGDERVDIAFPLPGETVADVAFFNQEGYGSGGVDLGAEPPWRHYTVRKVHDGGTRIDFDFVVHEGGLASGWAERAEPGHILGVFDPGHARSYYEPERPYDTQLLVADATGLPGLGRIIEELPAGVRAVAVIEVPTPEDRQEFTTAADVEYTWLYGSGLGLAPSALLPAVEALVLPTEGTLYAWVACESATSRALRRHLRTVRGLARADHHVVGYWRAGAEGHVPGINAEEPEAA